MQSFNPQSAIRKQYGTQELRKSSNPQTANRNPQSENLQSANRIPQFEISLPVMLGFFALAVQLVLLRAFLSVFQGNELLLTLVFVVWFSGIFSGALLGGWAGRIRGFVRIAAPAAVLALPVTALAGVAGILTVRTWLGVEPGLLLSLPQALPATALCVFPCSLLVGLAFPLITAASAARDPEAGLSPAGRVYWLESAGSLAGGLLYTFVWAGRVSAVAMLWICLVAGPAAFLAEQLARARRLRKSGATAAAAALILAAAFPLGTVNRLEQLLVRTYWNALAPGQALAVWADTRYQQLAVGEREGQFAVYSNGLLAVTFPDPFEVTRRVHLCLNQCADPRDVLLIGQGLEGEAQRVLDYPVRSLTLVILDPEYPRRIRPLLPAEDRARLRDPRLELVPADGVEYLRGTARRFDLVVLHTPPPATAAFNRFYTREYFDLVRRRLNPSGAVVVGLEASESFMGPEMRRYVGTLNNTLGSVFPRVIAAPGTSLLFFASGPAGRITLDADELARRLAARNLPSAASFRSSQFRLMLQPERVEWLRETLADEAVAPVNTDRRPVIYLQNLRLWDLVTEGRLGGMLAALDRLTLPWLLLIAAAALLLATAGAAGTLRGESPGRLEAARALAGMLVFGFLGMGLELVLLYHFQNLYGYLYSMLGLLVAGFMLGLTTGAWWMNRRPALSARDARRWAFFGLPAAGLALCAAAWVLFGRRPALALPLLFALMGAAGTLTGLYFPLGCRIYAEGRRTALATAAWLDAADHLGALAGAGVTGLLFLPVLGIDRTVFFFACLLLSLPLGELTQRALFQPGKE